MRHTVFLFDIDGTLILTGGAGRRAMEGAFRALYGDRGPAAVQFHFGGMTDRAIARAGIRSAGDGEPDSVAIEKVLDAYVTRLGAEVERSDQYRVLPGVHDVLARLAEGPRERIALGLGTGNIKRGAHTKLARGGLHETFSFGGFGCDHEERGELLRVGAERGMAMLGVARADCRVVVIGDTPKDVAAAKAIGAECIAVGTGGFAASELVALGAEHGFDDLTAASVLEALLGD